MVTSGSFSDLVKLAREKLVVGPSPIQRCSNKLRDMCRYLGGCARYMTGQLKNEKPSLSSIIDDIDAISKVRPLTTQEIEFKIQSNAQPASIL
jgi:putative component of membrane protein insertase Oxa1/YidC/SpoIIIJ protein YidD